MMTVSEKLEKARQARAAKAQAGIKLTKRNVVEIWSEDKLSLRKSINAKCFDCSGSQIEEVKQCTVKSCPLWLVRPYQEKSNG